jgi:histidine phosphotransferase ChpT
MIRAASRMRVSLPPITEINKIQTEAPARAEGRCGKSGAVQILTMTGSPDLRMAFLLTARLCHELTGPITAIGNGIEVLSEEGGELAAEALDLAAESARRATVRLRFYRFAYGFDGEAATAGPRPFDLAAGYFAATSTICDYREEVRDLPPAQQRLGCNLLLIGAAALVRGGRLVLAAQGAGLRLDANGATVSLAPEHLAALRLETALEDLSPRNVQGYFTGLLARAEGWRLLGAEIGPGRLGLSVGRPG